MKGISALLGNRWIIGALVIVLMALLIGFLGPHTGLAFLVSAAGRLAIILLLVVLWAALLLWQQLRRSAADRDLAAAVVPTATTTPATGDEQVLRRRFEEALQALRKWKGGRASLYELPWYIVIGPPGAGKTTLLQNSGLEFPLADQFGKRAVRGVGGTRNCDWWFTDQAILIDTAGRFVTQDSDELNDAAAWKAFLALLLKHRRRRPIDGVILAMSAAEVLGSDSDIEPQQRAIRARLAEITETLGLRVPVYVLLTKCDLVCGFAESFANLSSADRSQVFGATFALELSRAGVPGEIIAADLADLVERLEARAFAAAAAERDIGRRGQIVGFPGEVSILGNAASAFLPPIFRGAGLCADLRGVYLTSATQSDTPIERMLSGTWEAFGLGEPPVAATPGAGKAYFIPRLLKDVIFSESGLAGATQGARREERIRRLWLLGGIGALVLLVLILLLMSYQANTRFIAEVTQAAAPLVQTRPAAPGSTPPEFLSRLGALNAVVVAARRYDENRPWKLRFGLFQGGRLEAAASAVYLRELGITVGALADGLLADRLRTSPEEPERLYEVLKVYLSFATPKKLVPEEARTVLDPEWRERYEDDPATAQALAGYFADMVSHPKQFAPIPADENLVVLGRSALARASLPVLIYSRLRLAKASDSEHSFKLGQAMGLGAADVWVRRSGADLDAPLSELYTRQAFDEFSHTGNLKIVSDFRDDSWVLGDQAASLADTPQIAVAVEQIYERDYIRTWQELLGDLAFRRPTTTDEAADVLSKVASPTSPLRALLIVIDAQTNFAKPISGIAGVVGSATSAVGGAIDSATGGGSDYKPGAAIIKAFEPFHQLLAGSAGSAPVDQLLANFAKVAQQLRSAQAGGDSAAMQAALRDLDSLVAQLPPPLGQALAEVNQRAGSAAAGAVRGALGDQYRAQVVAPCTELVGRRYPIDPQGEEEVAPADFGAAFGPGGLYDAFMTATLAPLVDRTHTPWTWRPNAASMGAGAMSLAPFQSAERIRSAFFGNGAKEPAFDFTLTPQPLEAGVRAIKVTVNGQTLDYSGDAPTSVLMHWPGPGAGGASVHIDSSSSGEASISRDGNWAWFKILDASEVEAQSPTRFLITFHADSRSARVLLEAQSVRNPLASRDYRGFRCS